MSNFKSFKHSENDLIAGELQNVLKDDVFKQSSPKSGKAMKTLTIAIDEVEFINLGFNSETITFSELQEKIRTDYARNAMRKCHQIAAEVGLATMTFDEIQAEIHAVRNHAKACH